MLFVCFCRWVVLYDKRTLVRHGRRSNISTVPSLVRVGSGADQFLADRAARTARARLQIHRVRFSANPKRNAYPLTCQATRCFSNFSTYTTPSTPLGDNRLCTDVFTIGCCLLAGRHTHGDARSRPQYIMRLGGRGSRSRFRRLRCKEIVSKTFIQRRGRSHFCAFTESCPGQPRALGYEQGAGVGGHWWARAV